MLLRHLIKPKRIYLDYAAATPVRTSVLQVMEPFFQNDFANAGAIHQEGMIASKAVEKSREKIARILHLRSAGVYFTASGTEANNLAIYGLLRELTEIGGRPFSEMAIISTKTEHPSITQVLEHLSGHGVEVRHVNVEKDGIIDFDHLQTLLDEKVVLVTYAYANSETGVVQDVKRLSRVIKKFNTENKTSIKTHLDAAQAPLWLPIAADQLGVDMIVLDAGKCYGPKGIGVLGVRHGVTIKGIILGGGQEGGVRAGTENTPLIVGCAKALEIAVRDQEKRSERIIKLRDSLLELLLSEIDGVALNGSKEERLPNNVNISIPGIDSEFAVVTLDTHGIAASTKSACGGKDSSGSSVVMEMTGEEARANSTIRFSLGEENTRADIKRVVKVLKDHVIRTREFAETLT